MGLLDKLKNSYDYYKVDKYTKRRVSQSHFESHDRRYYENAYRDGDYLTPEDIANGNMTNSPTHSHLTYKQSRWVIPGLLRKPTAKRQ